MRLLSDSPPPAWAGQGGFLAALAALVLLLASCSSGNLFKDDPGELSGKSVPPIAVESITGMPPSLIPEMKAALARAGGDRDIGFVEGDVQEGQFTLAGQFRTVPGTTGVRVLFQWQLRDGEGVLLHSYGGEENAGILTSGDSWSAVSTAVLDRIALATAESMAVKLKELGYATRHAMLEMPPASYFAMAGPGAERDIDFETLGGPGVMTALTGLGPGGGLVPVEFEAPAEPELPAAEMAATDTAQPIPEPLPSAAFAEDEVRNDGKVEIKAVAVLPVEGSPGGGDAELTAAMRQTLAAAGWPVVGKPQADAITISGRVVVAKAQGEEQQVMVQWTVETPQGVELGDVKQANRVPAGALAAGWGNAAFAVAEAAALGIFDIITKYR